MTLAEHTPSISPAELGQLMEALPSMVGFWDGQKRLAFANKAYAGFFDATPEELHGRQMTDVLGVELYERQRPMIEAALGGELQVFERQIEVPQGGMRHVRARYVPHFEQGHPEGFFVVFDDITDKVLADRAAQATARQATLLEERQRIAADLHDLVIQRLFAAGLDLAAVQRAQAKAERLAAGEEGVAAGDGVAAVESDRIAAAAVGIDEAIRELRRAIYSLRELSQPTELPESISSVLENAERTLGFTPTIGFTGSLESVPAEAVNDILAVLNEALSNVARHAKAESVAVTLACTEDAVLLEVADDGRGMADTGRSSGLSNMRQRALRHGGTFGWRENQPHGTVVEWTIPIRPGRTA